MKSQILESISGLGSFAAYFVGAMVLLVVFCATYLVVTPYNEIGMIRDEGKTAPAVSFGGAVLGFTLPMASAISHSVSLLDMVIWSVVAMVVQILTFLFIRLCFAGCIKQITQDKSGAAAFVAVLSIAAGILNAASMSY